MGQFAERVHTDPTRIAAIERLIEKLPTNADVTLILTDGSRCRAVVSVRPSIEMFRDHDGNEGCNAVVRLERPAEPNWSRTVWLDQVRDVTHHDSTLGSES